MHTRSLSGISAKLDLCSCFFMEGDFLNLQIFFFFAKKYLLPPEGALDMSVFCRGLFVLEGYM